MEERQTPLFAFFPLTAPLVRSLSSTLTYLDGNWRMIWILDQCVVENKAICQEVLMVAMVVELKVRIGKQQDEGVHN